MNEIRSGLKEACPAKKPVVEIERLIDCLLPEAKLVNTQKAGGGNLELINKKETILSVILQLSGEISLLRRVKEDILVATASAPNVFGLLGSIYRFDTYKFRASEGSQIYILPQTRAIDLLTEKALVREVITYHSFIADIESQRGALLIAKPAYETICTLLLELAELPEEKRLKTSVANFILDRTGLARSGVMKILSDLRRGGYIEIKYGKLECIIKSFPLVY